MFLRSKPRTSTSLSPRQLPRLSRPLRCGEEAHDLQPRSVVAAFYRWNAETELLRDFTKAEVLQIPQTDDELILLRELVQRCVEKPNGFTPLAFSQG